MAHTSAVACLFLIYWSFFSRAGAFWCVILHIAPLFLTLRSLLLLLVPYVPVADGVLEVHAGPPEPLCVIVPLSLVSC